VSNPDAVADPRFEMLTWDWKSDAPLDDIAAAASRVSGGNVYITYADSGSDQVVVIVSATPLEYAEATELFQNWPDN